MIETIILIILCAYMFNITDPFGAATALRRKLLGKKSRDLLALKDERIKELQNEKNELEIKLYKKKLYEKK